MTTASAPLASRQPFPFVTWLKGRLLARWYDRHLQRLDLAEIDDHLLRDLGLTREDVRKRPAAAESLPATVCGSRMWCAIMG